MSTDRYGKELLEKTADVLFGATTYSMNECHKIAREVLDAVYDDLTMWADGITMEQRADYWENQCRVTEQWWQDAEAELRAAKEENARLEREARINGEQSDRNHKHAERNRQALSRLLADVGELADQYAASAAAEGYGGELWSTTEATLRTLVAKHRGGNGGGARQW